MSSKDLFEQSSSNFGIDKDRETQTSKIFDLNTTSNTTPTRPLPKNIEAKSKDENVKAFEFCEVIQDPSDPDSVSIIKESFSEEVITETPKGFSIVPGKPTANKYKYCREVIQPICKTFSSECPSYVTPGHKLDKEPVKEPKKPETPTNQEVHADNNCIQEKVNSKSCVGAMSSDDQCNTHCKTTFLNPEDTVKKCSIKTDQKKPCQNKSSETKFQPVPSSPSKENQENRSSERPKSPTCQKCDEVDESKLKCCISSCIKESIKSVKKGSSTCVTEIDKLIGVKHDEACEDKPTYYLLEKPRCPSLSGQPNDSSTCVPQKSGMQRFFDSQTQTVATIHGALKNFVGAVRTKTKEVLRSDSGKHINIKSESATDKGKDVKDCANVQAISSFIPEKIKQQLNKMDISTSSQSLEKVMEHAKVVRDRVASIVLSTVSMTKEADFKKIAEDILDAKFNKSSPLDQSGPNQKPPKPVSQEHEPSTNSNMFTTIKTKLFSIFGQKENHDDNDDNDDDDFSADRDCLHAKYGDETDSSN